MKRIFLIVFVLIQGVSLIAQKKRTHGYPKLVVGLVVDQMRWDYLYRYQRHYGKGGFNRLLNQGYTLNHVMINYLPTVTAIGHTSIYTGSVPAIHGIAGNDWTDGYSGKSIYCTADNTVKGIGASSDRIGAHSPRNLWSTTIGDQIRMATNFQAKVVGISLKDRASILPAGHNPTAAFWYDEGTGDFITSSYYMNELPQWVKDFNSQRWGDKLVQNGWDTLKPIQEYKESTGDNVSWEYTLGSATSPTFPYKQLAKDYSERKGIIRTTPFGNTLTLKMSEAAIDGYQMGRDDITDFLAINLASTDYVGHAFGPNSVEIQDTYIRLDREIKEFLNMLDDKIGKNNYLLFLSADHGGAHAQGYMQAYKMPNGFYDEGLLEGIKEKLYTKFSDNELVWKIDNYQIYLNKKKIQENKLDKSDIKEVIIQYLNEDPRILFAVDLEEIVETSVPEPIKHRMINGYNWKRSGDIQIITRDAFLPKYAKKGTTHSVWNSYDAHIPLIFFGKGVKKGQSSTPYHITDIAPTISQMLKIEYPSGCIGKPITEIVTP